MRINKNKEKKVASGGRVKQWRRACVAAVVVVFRHAAYLAISAAGVATMLLGDGSIARVSVGVVLAVVGVAGAGCRPYGEPLDRLAFAAMAYVVRRRGERAGSPRVAGTENGEIPKETPAAAPSQPARERARCSSVNPSVIRRVLVAIVVSGVAAIATTRVMDRPSALAPEPRVVVVPVPGAPPDPWEEVDRALEFSGDRLQDWELSVSLDGRHRGKLSCGYLIDEVGDSEGIVFPGHYALYADITVGFAGRNPLFAISAALLDPPVTDWRELADPHR